MTVPPPVAAPINRYAVAALVCAALTFVLPIFVPAILGIVFAVIGLVRATRLRRDGYPPSGLVLSGWALGLGIVMLIANVAGVWLVLNVLPRVIWIIFGGTWDSPPSG